MITATFQINRNLVTPLIEHILTNDLPLNLTVSAFKNYENGYPLQNVTVTCAEGDSECLNHALAHVINEYAAAHGRD